MPRIEITHIDQPAHRVTGKNAAPGRGRNRVDDRVELRTFLPRRPADAP